METAAAEALGLPSLLWATLVIRAGEPLEHSRGGWRSEVRFSLEEGYAVFREKCLAKFAEVCATIQHEKKQIELADDKEIYLKRAKNDSQD